MESNFNVTSRGRQLWSMEPKHKTNNSRAAAEARWAQECTDTSEWPKEVTEKIFSNEIEFSLDALSVWAQGIPWTRQFQLVIYGKVEDCAKDKTVTMLSFLDWPLRSCPPIPPHVTTVIGPDGSCYYRKIEVTQQAEVVGSSYQQMLDNERRNNIISSYAPIQADVAVTTHLNVAPPNCYPPFQQSQTSPMSMNLVGEAEREYQQAPTRRVFAIPPPVSLSPQMIQTIPATSTRQQLPPLSDILRRLGEMGGGYS